MPFMITGVTVTFPHMLAMFIIICIISVFLMAKTLQFIRQMFGVTVIRQHLERDEKHNRMYTVVDSVAREDSTR